MASAKATTTAVIGSFFLTVPPTPAYHLVIERGCAEAYLLRSLRAPSLARAQLGRKPNRWPNPEVTTG
jgi:hypothetical protein